MKVRTMYHEKVCWIEAEPLLAILRNQQVIYYKYGDKAAGEALGHIVDQAQGLIDGLKEKVHPSEKEPGHDE